MQQQAHEVRTQGWHDPMSVTLGEWYEYWLDTYMKDTVKLHLRQLPQLLKQALLCTGKNPAQKAGAAHFAGVLQLQIP